MTEPVTQSATSAKRMPVVAYLLSVLLIGNFLWRMLVPAHEYPMRSAQVLEMLIDGLMIVGLIGLRVQIPKALLVVALVAGVGLFGIRLHGDASWWTGHWSYWLPPR